MWLSALPKASFISISEISGNISVITHDSQGFYLKYSWILRWNYIQYINSLKVYPGIQKAKLKAEFILLCCILNPGLILVRNLARHSNRHRILINGRWRPTLLPCFGERPAFFLLFQEQGRLGELAKVFMQYLEHTIGKIVVHEQNSS